MAFALLVEVSGRKPADLSALLAKPLMPERESWGTSKDAVDAYAVAESLAGGPAPMRDRSEQTP